MSVSRLRSLNVATQCTAVSTGRGGNSRAIQTLKTLLFSDARGSKDGSDNNSSFMYHDKMHYL